MPGGSNTAQQPSMLIVVAQVSAYFLDCGSQHVHHLCERDADARDDEALPGHQRDWATDLVRET